MKVGPGSPSTLSPDRQQAPSLAPAAQLLIDLMAPRHDPLQRRRLEALAVGGGWPALRELYTGGVDAMEALQQRATLAWRKLDPRDLRTFAADHPRAARALDALRQHINHGHAVKEPHHLSVVHYFYLALIYGGLSGLHATAVAWPPGASDLGNESPRSASALPAEAPEGQPARQPKPPAPATSALRPSASAPHPTQSFSTRTPLPTATPAPRRASLAARTAWPTAPHPVPPPPPPPPPTAAPGAAEQRPPEPCRKKRQATPPSPGAATAAATLLAACAKRVRLDSEKAPQPTTSSSSNAGQAAESTDATSALRRLHRRDVDTRGAEAGSAVRRLAHPRTTGSLHGEVSATGAFTLWSAAPVARIDSRANRSATFRHFQLEFPALGTVELAWPDLVTLLAERPPLGDARTRPMQVRINGIELRMATAELRALVASLQPPPPLRR